METAERLRKLVEQSVIIAADRQIRATVSIGVTPARAKRQTRNPSSARVDRMMYRGKADGRKPLHDGERLTAVLCVRSVNHGSTSRNPFT